MKSQKNFPVNLSPDKPETGFLFFRVVEEILFFFTLTANDRGYGLGRAAGEFPVAIATKEMRAQRLPKAH